MTGAETPARRVSIALKLRALDLTDRVLRRTPDPFVPPRRYDFAGNSDFARTGDEFLAHFVALAGLRSQDRVLDIGCGAGRMARVLTGVLLPPDGSYDGFDTVRRGIDWCNRHYRTTSAPFVFSHVDVHHPIYAPAGTRPPTQVRFPYPDACFDLAIATSVFTHLTEAATDHYLAETARVLAPGGRLFATWFLIDSALPATAEAITSFSPGDGVTWVVDPHAPEAAVAYPSDWVLRRLYGHGFRDPARVVHGSWRGRPGRSAQDIIVATRE